jgi:hypothetical protein
MRFLLGLIAIVLILLLAAFMLGFIRLDQTQEASLPRISVEGGSLPAYNASVAQVEVGTRNETVAVPEVHVGTEDKTVQLPSVDVTKPR